MNFRYTIAAAALSICLTLAYIMELQLRIAVLQKHNADIYTQIDSATATAMEDCRIRIDRQKLMSRIDGCFEGIELLCTGSSNCLNKLGVVCRELKEF